MPAVLARLMIAILACCTARVARAQEVEQVRAAYTKVEYQIAMRDGARLFTVVYLPRDRTKTYPILLVRTPYGVGPYGAKSYRDSLGPSQRFQESGYIFAYQDVRGCFMSEGKFEDVRPIRKNRDLPGSFDESTDAYDTIDFLLKTVPNHNGRVGISGISYPGFYAAAALIDAHPALKAASPQAPVIDWFLGDDTHHNGALFLQQEFTFDAVFGADRPEPTTQHGEEFDHGMKDGYRFFLQLGPLPRADQLYFKGKRKFWSDVMRHGTYDDFWKQRTLVPHLKQIKPAVMTVGGWFDAQNLYGALHCYQGIENSSPGARNTLVMGPWSHGGWSSDVDLTVQPLSFGAGTNSFFRDQIEFPFFEYHLKSKGDGKQPEAWVFETGRNRWHALENWPPKTVQPTSYYLGSRRSLGTTRPTEPGQETFTSDPAKPVPYTKTVPIECPEGYMVEDQRFASRRADVLVYETPPLKQDLTIAGPIDVELFVSTTGTDADWVVKLIDVYPENMKEQGGVAWGGYQQLVRGDVMRGKFRESFEKPSPFIPDEPARVPFRLQDCFHTFRAGHRVMVQVQSSWFPLVDRNPQTFVDIYNARETDFVKATHHVHHEPERASRLILPILPPVENQEKMP